jgi:molybdopterin-containing oxidoreductase family iron-sulfur binding subunit
MMNGRSGGGMPHQVKWADVDGAMIDQLKAIAAKGGRVRVLAGKTTSESTRRLIQEFLSSFRDGALVEYEGISHDEILDGQQESYGKAVLPTYHFDKAEVVVSFSADFLGDWVSPLEHAAGWAKRRKLQGENSSKATMSKFYAFESTPSITGSNADERRALRPGDEMKVALAVAHELIVKQKRSRFAAEGSVTSALQGYTAEAVAAEVGEGLTAEFIRKVSEDLWSARGRGLVVGGSLQAKTLNAVGLQVAVNLLNSACENEGSTIDGVGNTQAETAGSISFLKLIAEMNSGSVDALIVWRANPIYSTPSALGFKDALKKVRLVATFSQLLDETARQSDWVLADVHGLENWGDAHPRTGVYSLQQPAIRPIHEARGLQDSLIVWGRALGAKSGLLGKIVPTKADEEEKTWYDYLKANWQETLHPKFGKGQAFVEFWETTLQKGVLVASAAPISGRAFKSTSLKRVPAYQTIGNQDLKLALYSKISMGDGRMANNSWLQEMPDPVTTIAWDNFVNVAPKTAEKMGLSENDVVVVKAAHYTAEFPVHIQPGMHANAVSVAVGYGRESAGHVGTGVGINAYPYAIVSGDQVAMSGAAVSLSKTGKRYELAGTLRHHLTMDRPIINDISLAEYRESAHAEKETAPELRAKELPSMWPLHPYNQSYRWGMAIDLNSCTGCGACVMACQSENNIPVVGRAQVRMSREMHWIRIDRYYSGEGENPETLFQPMLCQHCENAPCETVCPVLATMHDSEGLNQMVYNRCVGTRYCQNNCPYKVRRFNFLDFWKDYKDTQNMVWNPDVTVRTRGVMEKCTFCIQRIQEARFKAQDRGDLIKDGELRSACQQTCPTEAIVFGNINDPNSRVSKLRSDPRAFRALEVLNVKPSISYLTKVRNRDAIKEGKDEVKHV